MDEWKIIQRECFHTKSWDPEVVDSGNLYLKPLQSLGANQRNYAEIQITIEPDFSVVAQLKVTRLQKFYLASIFDINIKRLVAQAVSSNLYEITDWMSVDEADEEQLFENKD